jgi:hypothetical protein
VTAATDLPAQGRGALAQISGQTISDSSGPWAPAWVW